MRRRSVARGESVYGPSFCAEMDWYVSIGVNYYLRPRGTISLPELRGWRRPVHKGLSPHVLGASLGAQ